MTETTHRVSTPIILGLCHAMSEVGQVHPTSVDLSSTFDVEFGIVFEHARLRYVFLVVGGLLLVRLSSDLLVLSLGQTRRDVGFLREFAGDDLLLTARSVVVGVSDGGPEVKVGDLLEEGLVELGR